MAKELISSILFLGSGVGWGEELVKNCRRQSFTEEKEMLPKNSKIFHWH